MKTRGFLPLALVALLLAGCAGPRAFEDGQRLIGEGKPEEGLKQLEQAMKENPKNVEYRAVYMRTRDTLVNQRLAQGEAALKAGRLDEAQGHFRAVLPLHAENTRAPAGLAAVEMARRNQLLLEQAQAAVERDDLEPARMRLRAVLAQDPVNAPARALLKTVEEKAGRPQGAQIPQLAPGYRKAITLEFRDAPLKTVFDALSRQSGVNFVFDKDVRTDQKATVFARNTAIADAIDMILATSQLAKKTLNANTLLVYPDQPQKQKQYEELVVRAFFLANIESKAALTLVKTLTKSRDVYVDEKLNLLFVRDTPDAIRLVEKVLAVADQPEPEVMLEVEILEVARSKLLELGVQWPTQFTVIPPPVTTETINADGVKATNTTPTGVLTVDSLKSLTSKDIGVSPNPTLTLRAEDGDVSLLANPRIRVKNREKAKIHVGDKVPVITSNTTSTGVVSESVSYLDVGLKLDVEPQVFLEGEVGMKVGLEVSNIVQQVKSATGTLTYQLGSRNATTVLRVKDGETQVLAGLIADEERSSASKVPFLGDLPIVGRLFSTNRDDARKTEIVLLITPRILRNLERPELAQAEFFAGTEGAVSDRPLLLRPAAGAPGVPSRPPANIGQPGAAPSGGIGPSAGQPAPDRLPSGLLPSAPPPEAPPPEMPLPERPRSDQMQLVEPPDEDEEPPPAVTPGG
ncbi:MAG: type II secretion system protein D [Thiobacillaceae bacterium]|jgi:general secretion pathway protein D|nr:type II secretion system protein D [Thiobacillaceae bacterium]